MSEEVLYVPANVGPRVEQVRGEAVSQRMELHVIEACAARHFSRPTLQSSTGCRSC